MKAINLAGKKFGKWIVVEKAERPPTDSPSKPMYWKCRCECGNERIIPAHNLRCKRTLSCGHDMILPDYQALYNEFISTNKNRFPGFSILTFQEFLEFTTISNCHYCHFPVKWVKRGYKTAYNLDRKDNSQGYIKQNCVVCCPRCNFGKSNRYSYEEWYEMNQCFRDKRMANHFQ